MSNWQNDTFHAPRQPDRQVLDSALKTLADSGIKEAEVFLTPGIGGGQIRCQLAEVQTHAELQRVISLDGALIREFRFAIPTHAALVVTRQPKESRDDVLLDVNAMNQVNPQQQQLSRDQLLRLATSARSNFGELMARDNFAFLGKGVAEHYQQRESNLARLEATLANITREFGENAAAQRSKLDKEFEERRHRLDQELQAKREQLVAEAEAKNVVLGQREEALKQRLAEVDDRAAMHARRGIREEMKRKLAESEQNFKLSIGTQALRRPVFWSTLALLVLFAAGLIYYSSILVEASGDMALLVVVAVKGAALAAAFGSTAVFFIRWNNHWSEQHAAEEFKLKRLALDLDRASWVVEMMIELAREKDAKIGPELLGRLTQNLFVESSPTRGTDHPMDGLASALLGSSSELSLELPGGAGSLKLDRKGLRELAKKGSDE